MSLKIIKVKFKKQLRERDQLMAKKREKEMEIQALRRQKAIEQSVSSDILCLFYSFNNFQAEEKMKHFKRLACFIQTQTKPPLFFLPAKHTLRTLELLKESSKKIESKYPIFILTFTLHLFV